MNVNTQVIPASSPHVYVDEPSEFRGLARQTDARKQRQVAQIEADVRERNRQRREARQERKRIVRNCKLLCLGIVAACCTTCAVFAVQATYPLLAIFPAAISLISIWSGVSMK